MINSQIWLFRPANECNFSRNEENVRNWNFQGRFFNMFYESPTKLRSSHEGWNNISQSELVWCNSTSISLVKLESSPKQNSKLWKCSKRSEFCVVNTPRCANEWLASLDTFPPQSVFLAAFLGNSGSWGTKMVVGKAKSFSSQHFQASFWSYADSKQQLSHLKSFCASC